MTLQDLEEKSERRLAKDEKRAVMMSAKQTGAYLANKLLLDIENESFVKWLENSCENNELIYLDEAFREELRERLVHLHETCVPSEAYEQIEIIERRFRDLMGYSENERNERE